jgi:hypothetical protein
MRAHNLHQKEDVKWRCAVVGFFRKEVSIMRPIGAVLFCANDEWQTPNCQVMVGAFAWDGCEDKTSFSA